MGHEEMLQAVLDKRSYIVAVSDSDRGIGKTYSLRNLGLELQSLGYKVMVASLSQSADYYAEVSVSKYGSRHNLRGYSKPVLLVDDILQEDLEVLLSECRISQIPVVGYANIL